MALIVLKIDVDTLRGTREGVPNLSRMLREHEAGATFLFSLGPDHTGWALRRAFRPGFLKKVSRTSVVEHYGLRTLMYGVLLPGPDIGARLPRQVSRPASTRGTTCSGKTTSASAMPPGRPARWALRTNVLLRSSVTHLSRTAPPAGR